MLTFLHHSTLNSITTDKNKIFAPAKIVAIQGKNYSVRIYLSGYIFKKGFFNLEQNQNNTINVELIQKLSKIRKIADVVSKSRKGFNYTYADISDILAKVKAGMDKYNVSLIPTIVPGTTRTEQITTHTTKFDKQGQPYQVSNYEYLTTSEMRFIWVDDETGDTLAIPWTVMGAQADPSQAFGSGLTYCTRYFLCNYFQIPQVDTDVDAYRSKQKEAEAAEDAAVARGITAQIDVMVRSYLSDNPDKREEITKFIKRYIKSGNYLDITTPEIAAKLLKDFKEKYVSEEAKESK